MSTDAPAITQTPATSPDDLLDTQAAADYVGCSRTTINTLRAEGILPQAKRGPGVGQKRQHRYYRRADLDAYKRSLETRHTPTNN